MVDQEQPAKTAEFDYANHTFVQPTKKIDTVQHLELFKSSIGCKELSAFISALQSACQHSRMTKTDLTPRLEPIYAYLEKLSNWIDEVPPIEQPMRFGNKAFRIWLDKVMKEHDSLIGTFSSAEGFDKAIPELKFYLEDCYGSYERIDYGTGHELNFVVFLFCMFKLGVLQEQDLKPAVNKVFQRYLTLMRKIQLTYYLEPAGSHGVWGLDDYQHLAFLFGASQLCQNADYVPDSIHEDGALAEHEDYMYFGCIRFIKQVKKGVAFGESSPMLNDISAVPNWEKVSSGLMKMFQAEVFGKLPVIKHLKFGSILTFDPNPKV